MAVWWLKLGIQVDRIEPGHPEQNGRHERFHLTLQEEATTPPARTPRQQQARFDRLRQEFNTERPHGGPSGQQPPSRVHVASSRPYPTRLEDPWYDATHEVRRVRHNGEIKWRGDLVFVSAALRHEPVGLAETERGDWLVRFMHVELGRIDRDTRRFTPAWYRSAAGDVIATVKTAVEMPSLWKPHTGFHSDLEISHRTRDSHIPTAGPRRDATEKKTTRRPITKCYPCIRSKVLPMFPVAQDKTRIRSEGSIQRSIGCYAAASASERPSRCGIFITRLIQ